MKIGIADPQARVRYSLRILLEQQPGIKITGEAADCQELFGLVRDGCPDLVLVDWNLPDLPAVDLLRLLREQFPGLLILSMSTRSELVQAALMAGANAYACKTEPPQKLLAVLRKFQERRADQLDG